MIGAGPPISDIVGHRQREDQRRLQDHADLPAQGRDLVFANIDAVDRHPPACRIEEPRQQPEHRRFAGAGLADDRHPHARLNRKVDLVQDRGVRAIAEADILPRDRAPRALRRELARAALQIRLRIQDLEDAARSNARAGDKAPALGDLVDGIVKLREVGDEDDQLPERQRAGHDGPCAGINHDRRAASDDDADRAGIERLPIVEPQRCPQAFAAGAHKAAVFLLLLRKSLHDLDRRNAPLYERIDAGVGIAHLGRDLDDLAIKGGNQAKQDRHDGQRQQRQQRIHREQHDQHAGEQDHRREDRQYAVHDHRLNREAVGGNAVHQIADPLTAVIGERQALEMRIEVAAQIVDHVLADPDRRVIVQQRQRAGPQIEDDEADAGDQQQQRGR